MERITSVCRVFIDQRVRRFTERQFSELNTELASIDNHTTLRPVNDPKELQLRPDGSTKDGYRFTYQGFSAAAQLLAPGLISLLPDLSGMVTPANAKREHIVDPRFAIATWNQIVDLRFSYFAYRRVLRNEDSRTIEGFLGQKYRYLENRAVFTEANEMVTQHSGSRFFAGLLTGRQLCLWYKDPEPLGQLKIDGQLRTFYLGYYFANGESTGTSVKGTVAIFTPWGPCLGPFRQYGQQITHAGKNFDRRLGQMFVTVCQTELDRREILQGFTNLRKPLGFEVGWTPQAVRTRRKAIIAQLSMLQLSKTAAREIVDIALYLGSEEQQPLVAEEATSMYSKRTVMDLFVPLLSTAKRVAIQQRECYEQAAFSILFTV